jgi:hypothetical protein
VPGPHPRQSGRQARHFGVRGLLALIRSVSTWPHSHSSAAGPAEFSIVGACLTLVVLYCCSVRQPPQKIQAGGMRSGILLCAIPRAMPRWSLFVM